MSIDKRLAVWHKLTHAEQQELQQMATYRTVKTGALIAAASDQCDGLMLVCSGQLRAFILSDEGKEITLYRLLKGDICLFSAACILQNIRFDITLQAEKDCRICILPAMQYKRMMTQSLTIANYTNEIISERLSQIMWLVEQILFKSFDVRLAGFLLSESALNQTDILGITHERIAAHLGTAREVVTRMLRYFQSEGWVELQRGSIKIADKAQLEALAHA